VPLHRPHGRPSRPVAENHSAPGRERRCGPGLFKPQRRSRLRTWPSHVMSGPLDAILWFSATVYRSCQSERDAVPSTFGPATASAPRRRRGPRRPPKALGPRLAAGETPPLPPLQRRLLAARAGELSPRLKGPRTPGVSRFGASPGVSWWKTGRVSRDGAPNLRTGKLRRVSGSAEAVRKLTGRAERACQRDGRVAGGLMAFIAGKAPSCA